MTDYRESFEKIGVETLRLRIGDPHSGYQGELLRQAEAWIKERDDAAARHARSNRRWMIVGAVAAIVAAITGIVAAITGIISVWPK
jgi:hypothetical protein